MVRPCLPTQRGVGLSQSCSRGRIFHWKTLGAEVRALRAFIACMWVTERGKPFVAAHASIFGVLCVFCLTAQCFPDKIALSGCTALTKLCPERRVELWARLSVQWSTVYGLFLLGDVRTQYGANQSTTRKFVRTWFAWFPDTIKAVRKCLLRNFLRLPKLQRMPLHFPWQQDPNVQTDRYLCDLESFDVLSCSLLSSDL